MSERKENFEVVPESGWGVSCYKGNTRTGGISLWDEDDIEVFDFTDREKAAFNSRNEHGRRYPSRLRAYGLWNVSTAQLLGPSWTPIPYRMLDEACMLFVMILCPTANLRGRYWPFNFDQSGRPRQTRHPIGFGIHCHQGTRKDSAFEPVFQTEIETFLVWKRHHIFGGREAHNLTVTEGSRDVRMNLGTSDPSFWSYGSQLVPDNTTGTGQDFRLHFYFDDAGSIKDLERVIERAGVNLRGY